MPKKPTVKKKTAKTKPVKNAPAKPTAKKTTPPTVPVEKPLPIDQSIGTRLFMVDRPSRLEFFLDLGIDGTSDQDYWHYLGCSTYIKSSFGKTSLILKLSLTSKRPHREYMMDETERAEFTTLPDEFTIYRGHIGRNASGPLGRWTRRKPHGSQTAFLATVSGPFPFGTPADGGQGEKEACNCPLAWAQGSGNRG